MAGLRSHRKGYRFEHAVEALARAHGHDCRRVPLSGSAPHWAGDLLLDGQIFEAKTRARGFRTLHRWLNGRFGLVLGADRQPALVVLRLEDYLTLGRRPERPCGASENAGEGPAGHSRD